MKIFGSSKDFIKGNDIEWEIVGKGLKRKIMGYDDKIMLVKVFFDKGASLGKCGMGKDLVPKVLNLN